MSKDSIQKKLNDLYAEPKSRNFLNHLIKAYFPISKVVKVVEKPVEGKLLCVLTNQRLNTVSDILISQKSEEFTTSMNSNIVASVEGNLEPKAFTKEVNGRLVAFTGEKTSTFISYAGIQELFEWVNAKVTAKDKHISWLVNSIKNAGGAFPKRTYAEANGYRKPATTLGDLDSLQKLKLQFQKEGY